MQQGRSQVEAPPPSPAPQLEQQQWPELNSSHQTQMPLGAALPINARPSPAAAAAAAAAAPNFEELSYASGGGGSGNRWPRQETQALLKIRSDLGAAFRDAPLKGPLWEQVSSKLAGQGYKRSAEKCKEKFENVQKYYKRTKDGRARRQDGKSYRFFTQLEALCGTNVSTTTTTAPSTTSPTMINFSQNQKPPPVAAERVQPMQISAPTPISTTTDPQPTAVNENPTASAVTSSSYSESDDDNEATEDGPSSCGGERKRKREYGGSGRRKMMAFVEGLMRQVMERQESMQQRFMETLEKREEERIIRDEAWRRQEMSRLSHQHDLASNERAASAARGAAIISFLQKATKQSKNHQPPQPPPSPEAEEGDTVSLRLDPSSSRWPKPEVHALIDIRSELDLRYQESSAKGPLWEEISAGMKRVGYNRSAKRCKEKWENINKYYKKVKESNKKRPEDAKTCPYFHQLHALYRRKLGGGTLPAERQEENDSHLDLNPSPISMIALPATSPPPDRGEMESKSGKGGRASKLVGSGKGLMVEMAVEETTASSTIKKADDHIMMQQMGAQLSNDNHRNDADSDNMNGNDDNENDEDSNDDGRCQIQLIQHQNTENSNSEAVTPNAGEKTSSLVILGSGHIN